MAEMPSLDSLTRMFLDLWQDQVSALAADPKTAEHWHRMVELALGMPTATAAAFGLRPAHDAAGAPGAAAPAAASGLGGHDLGELVRRLAELEGRVAVLESGTLAGGKRPSPRRASRKPRAKPEGS